MWRYQMAGVKFSLNLTQQNTTFLVKNELGKTLINRQEETFPGTEVHHS